MIVLLALGLGVDAFAVAASCSTTAKFRKSDVLLLAMSFGMFQAGMAGIGALLGDRFGGYIETFGPWLVFLILAAIGGKMIWEAFFGTEDSAPLSFRVEKVLLLSVATSIDAFAAGIGLRFMTSQIIFACLLIGIAAFGLTLLGCLFGTKLGKQFRKSATIAGGCVLIALGIRALLM